MSDSTKIALVVRCSQLVDDGLSPLVAASMVHPEIAKIIRSNLRTAILESCGASVSTWMELPRTQEAIRGVNPTAEDVTDFLEGGGA